ncbi:MAG: uncharacterized protein K0R81_2494 [Microbacterium sp.]|nr:uncharacterized protein [Microbacterium sp.]
MGEMTWTEIVPSVMLIIAGGALWWWSIALTVGAYRGERVPVWRNPPKAPGSWLVPLLAGSVAVVLLLVPYFAAVVLHNRRVDAA